MSIMTTIIVITTFLSKHKLYSVFKSIMVHVYIYMYSTVQYSTNRIQAHSIL